MQVPQHIVDHLKELNTMAEAVGGRKVFLVGGAVRDLLLGKEPKDFDFVTNLAPDLVDGFGFPQVGKSFPVYHTGVGELATTRTERKNGTGYTGFDTAYTASFKEDCLRRDLTINAILWHPDMGLVCPIERSPMDLHTGTLHACSEAFAEDPLRVLRVARFYSQTDKMWSISPETYDLMAVAAKELHTLPADRVRGELLRAKSLLRFHFALNFNREVGIEVSKWLPVSNYVARTSGNHINEMALIEYLSCFDEPRDKAILNLGFGTSYVAAAKTFETIREGIWTPEDLIKVWKSSKRGLTLPWTSICPMIAEMDEAIKEYSFEEIEPSKIQEIIYSCAAKTVYAQGFKIKMLKNRGN